MRSKTIKITPANAEQWLKRNTANRPMSTSVVRGFADAMRRGEWLVTHQGIAFDTTGDLVDGQHRLAAVVAADITVAMTVFTDVPVNVFDVLDTGKRRNAADVLAIAGEHNVTQLASMLRTIWQYHHRPTVTWSGGAASVSNPQILDVLAEHPAVRDYISLGEQISVETGTIKSAAGAASYLVSRANTTDLSPWFDGIVDGAGLARNDPRLTFRNTMLNLARHKAGQVQRLRGTREHVTLYLTAFNAWATGQSLDRLRYHPRDPVPAISAIQ